MFHKTGDISQGKEKALMGSSSFPGSSAGKESTCNAQDPGSIPGLGRSAGEGVGYPLQYSWASLVTQTVNNLCSIPGLGRSPGEGNGYPHQYSGLENSMDCIVREVTKSRTQLRRLSSSSSSSSSLPIPTSPVAQLVKNLPAMWQT